MNNMGGHYFHKKTVRDVPLDGHTILLRADYNVPLNKDGTIADDYRILQSLPTLRYLLDERNARIVICSHLGRPKGKVVPELSLEVVAGHLEKLLKRPVTFVNRSVGDSVRLATKRLRSGEVVLLENLRFHSEEEANDADFAHELAKDSNARYFVQDGFGVVHRAHASTVAITQYLPSVGGLLLEKEYQEILGSLHAPKRPLTAVLGGAKVADKIEMINTFISQADQIIIGGAMANTFLQYKGIQVGKSFVEDEQTAILDTIYQNARKKVGPEKVDDFLYLPKDVAVAQSTEGKQPRKEVPVAKVHPEEMILDVGSKSMSEIEKLIGRSGTVIWNGTLGLAEMLSFAYGSSRLALHLARHPDITSIIGGGDTADFVLGWDKKHKGASFTHISTGGGACLELIGGKALPGVESLLKA